MGVVKMVWLVGVVVRRYTDFLIILLIPKLLIMDVGSEESIASQ